MGFITTNRWGRWILQTQSFEGWQFVAVLDFQLDHLFDWSKHWLIQFQWGIILDLVLLGLLFQMYFLGKFPSLPVGSLLKFRVGLVCFFGVQLATSKDKVALEASGFWLANSMEKCGWAMGGAGFKRLPSRELTYPPNMAFWRWFSELTKVGYVSSLEGMHQNWWNDPP